MVEFLRNNPEAQELVVKIFTKTAENKQLLTDEGGLADVAKFYSEKSGGYERLFPEVKSLISPEIISRPPSPLEPVIRSRLSAEPVEKSALEKSGKAPKSAIEGFWEALLRSFKKIR